MYIDTHLPPRSSGMYHPSEPKSYAALQSELGLWDVLSLDEDDYMFFL